MTVRRGSVALLTLLAVACVDRLPDQDLRIRQATPVAKLTAKDLWADFHQNAGDAARRYHGHAIEMSGAVTRAQADALAPFLMFAQADVAGIKAFLLIDDAPAVLKGATPNAKLTLRCFCEGLAGTDVVLKSCIRP